MAAYGAEWKVKEGQAAAIHKAQGPKKVALIADVLRTVVFMSRYENNLTTKEDNLRQLQKHWWEQSMGRPKEKKQEEDTAQSVEYFGMLGWKGEDGVTDARLGALLRRVRAYKEAWEKMRDQQGGKMAPGDEPTVDWRSPPFSTDGLQSLAEAVASEVEARLAAANAVPVAKTVHGPPGTISVGPATGMGEMGFLMYTVRLLARCRWDDIGKMEERGGAAKQLSVYRNIRTQKFIEFTERDIAQKERKMRDTYAALERPRQVLTGDQMNGFFERLMEDAGKRQAAADKLLKDKLGKEAEIMGSSALYRARPRSAR